MIPESGGNEMKVCIVGGGGGASNAANIIRSLDKEARIDIFTNRGEIGNLPCEIPFVLKGTLPSWESSFAFRDRFYKERDIGVHLDTEVTEILREEKCIVAGGESYQYDKVVLDTGATPVIPPIPGLNGHNEFTLSTGLSPARVFEEAIPTYASAAVIGTGQIALETAAILQARGYNHVYLLGRSDRILRAYLDEDMVSVVEEKIRENSVELILGAGNLRVTTRGEKKFLFLSDREIEVDIIFLAAGAEPNSGLAQRAGIEIGETGAVAVNEYLQTSDPDIYAIGDCMENWDTLTGTRRRYQTATNAAKTGRIAGRNLVLGNVLAYQGTVMTFVTEVYGCEVGTVGLTEDYAREQGFDVVTSTTTSSTRRRAFGGVPITIKLIADRTSRTLLGAQITSEEMVAGKIDRLAVAIAEKVPLQRLSLIDTCYSPTVGAGYEAVTMALDRLLEKVTA
jgi:NADH oxidase (H2O2-forming)